MSGSDSIEMLRERPVESGQFESVRPIADDVIGALASVSLGADEALDLPGSHDDIKTDAQDMQSAREVRYRTSEGSLINFEISAVDFEKLEPEEQLLVLSSRFKGVDFSRGKTPIETMQPKLISDRDIDEDILASLLTMSDRSVEITGLGEKVLQDIAKSLSGLAQEYGEYGDISLSEALRKYVQESGGIVFSEVEGASAAEKTIGFLQSHDRYRKMQVKAALSGAVKSGFLKAHKLGDRIVAVSQDGYELTEKDLKLLKELQDAVELTQESVPEKQESESEKNITFAYKLKKMLQERGSGIRTTRDESVNAQIQKLLGIEKAKNMNQYISNSGYDPEILILSFPKEQKSNGPKKRQRKQVEYIGLVEFKDDPLTQLKFVVSQLRAECEDYLKNLKLRHKTPSPSYRAYVALVEHASAHEWTEHPLSELEEAQIKLQNAVRKLAEHNQTLRSDT